MKLRSIKIDLKFIPEFNGNRELPVDEQVVIYFSRIPGRVERANYIGFKMDVKSSMEMVNNDPMLVSAFINRIENLEDEVDGKIKKIKNGQDLSKINNPLLDDLFVEIRNYLFPESEEFSEGESLA